MKHEHKWEEMSHDTGSYMRRTAIFGGWLVHIMDDAITDRQDFQALGSQWRTSLTFVPDPNHEWRLDTDYTIKAQE